MVSSISEVVACFKREWTKSVLPGEIREICASAGHMWRERILDPATTIQLVLLQTLHRNTALTHIRHLSGLDFSAAALCKARKRIPVKIFEEILERIRQRLHQEDIEEPHWLGHRTFFVDGSTFSMPDTPELQGCFGQPGGQALGCGFPVAHLLALFHAGSGMVVKVLTSPLRTHEMSKVAMLHPELKGGDVLVGDSGFCSYAHLSLLIRNKSHAVFRVSRHQNVSFRAGRAYNQPRETQHRKGLPSSKGLDVLRCKTVAGILRELYAFCIVYNFVRLVMIEAAHRQGVHVDRISFIDALRWLATANKNQNLVLVSGRKGRLEPRVKKRRPKQYRLMNKTRQTLQKQLRKQNVAA